VSIIDSVRVLGAMARITAPSLIEAARGHLDRGSVDERARWFGRRVVELLDIDLRATGADRVPPGRASVYLSNHQSHLDIPVLYATLPSPTIRMLGKKELFQIPLWGRGLRAAEFIEVDRSNHARAVQSIEHAKRLIGKLKKGGFHLAKDTATPIVPVAIRGTIDILPRGSRIMRRGKRVDVTIGAPIAVLGRDIDSLVDEVFRFLQQHVER
jgi:1-acyl-sn-glycerol-3-phosphate acyltransferase